MAKGNDALNRRRFLCGAGAVLGSSMLGFSASNRAVVGPDLDAAGGFVSCLQP